MTDLNVEGNMAECYCKIMEDAGEAGRCNPCFDSMKADKELFEKRWNDAEEALRKLAGKLYVTDLQVSELKAALKALVDQHFEGHGHECPDKLWVNGKALLTDKPKADPCDRCLGPRDNDSNLCRNCIREREDRVKRKSETCDHDWMKIDPDSAHVIQRKCRKCGLLAV